MRVVRQDDDGCRTPYQGLGGTEQVLACLGQLISTEENGDISSLSALCLRNVILADLVVREPVALSYPLYLRNVLGLSLVDKSASADSGNSGKLCSGLSLLFLDSGKPALVSAKSTPAMASACFDPLL